MKLNKQEKAFIKRIYKEKESGTNWRWAYPDEYIPLVDKLFPEYKDKHTLNLGWVTFKEYPEIYVSFLEEELEYWRRKCSKLMHTVQTIMEE